MFASVVIDTGATSSIESLTYKIPDGLAERLRIGSCVLVPLGPRQAVGYVIALEDESPVENIRPIISELDSPVRLSDDLLQLAKWISHEYLCPLQRTVATMLPGVMHCRLQTRIVLEEISELPHLTPSEAKLLERIRNMEPNPSIETLIKGADRASIQRNLRQLEGKGVLKRVWQLISPSGKPRVLKGVKIAGNVDLEALVSSLPDKQAEVFRVLSEIGREVTLVELAERYGISATRVSTLEKKGLLELVDIKFRRNPAFHKREIKQVQLSLDQQNAVGSICDCINSKSYHGHLLFGVTASGKTEVYLRCIDHVLAAGKTALILLPEIALTTQVMNIFKSRFGDQVAVLHSALSAGERCDEWIRIEEGEARVVLGARSAVFAPLSNIGLVVVDEEHEGSYKQHDTQPRYNAKDIAIQRARTSNAALVLGSATPCIESYYLAEQNHFKMLTMASRIENRPMPAVYVADLRKDLAESRVTIFSQPLQEAIRLRLERGEQVMLLQNRRAYSTFLLCRDCGFVMRCPNCAVTLKFHRADRKVSCHHCDHVAPAPDSCPKCEGRRVKGFGIGTEKVEEETRNTFPTARILRMDRDTTARKGSHGTILEIFRNGEADILVGTQMIAKGLDFPNVTLVGVISADTSLNLPDFRASERTYQLVSQVAGRAGRGKTPGEVFIQTFDPDNYAIQCAVDHDYVSFYNQEVEMRKEINYPPFGSLVNLFARDEDEKLCESRLKQLVKELKSTKMVDRIGVEIIGPQPAVLSKLKGEYRWHLVLRSRDRSKMLDLLRQVLEKNASLRKYLTVDVDPMSML